MKCPTTKIKSDNEQGFVIINEDDFDPKTHKEFKEPKPRKKAASKAKDK